MKEKKLMDHRNINRDFENLDSKPSRNWGVEKISAGRMFLKIWCEVLCLCKTKKPAKSALSV